MLQNTNLSLSNLDKIPYFVIATLEKANTWAIQISKTKCINFSGTCKLRTYIKNIYPTLKPVYQQNIGYYLNSLNKLRNQDILPILPAIYQLIPIKTFQNLYFTLHLFEEFELLLPDNPDIVLGYRYILFDKNYREDFKNEL